MDSIKAFYQSLLDKIIDNETVIKASLALLSIPLHILTAYVLFNKLTDPATQVIGAIYLLIMGLFNIINWGYVDDGDGRETTVRDITAVLYLAWLLACVVALPFYKSTPLGFYGVLVALIANFTFIPAWIDTKARQR